MKPDGFDSWTREEKRAWLDRQWGQWELSVRALTVLGLASPFLLLAGGLIAELWERM